MAELTVLPCIICDIDDKTSVIFGLLENIQRKDLDPIEEAQGLKRLIDEFLLTHEQIGQALGVPRTSITNTLRLLALSDTVKWHLQQKNIDVGHAKVLMPLEHAVQKYMVEKIVEQKLSVRELETELKKSKKKLKALGEGDLSLLEFKMATFARRLSQYLTLRVDYKINPLEKGHFSFHFTSLDEAQAFVDHVEMVQMTMSKKKEWV